MVTAYRLFCLIASACLCWNTSSVSAFQQGIHRHSLNLRYPVAKAKRSRIPHELSTGAASWAVAHVAGGCLGVPIIAKAIKSWYTKIDLPRWTPPNSIFSPMWTTLYCMMGVSAYRVFKQTSLSTLPMQLWFFHCFLNVLWAPVFFGFKRLRLGLAIQYVLVASLFAIIPLFYHVNQLSGFLLAPYFCWLLFATALNWSICSRNPTVNGCNAAVVQAEIAKLQREAAKYAGVL